MTNLSTNRILVTLFLFSLLFTLLASRCGDEPQNESSESSEVRDPLRDKVTRFTLDVGSQLINNCSSNALGQRRMFTNYREVQGNRLEITMYVEWDGRTSGCHYRVDGVLTINQDGSDPEFRRTSTDRSSTFCIFRPGCVRNFRPAPCR